MGLLKKSKRPKPNAAATPEGAQKYLDDIEASGVVTTGDVKKINACRATLAAHVAAKAEAAKKPVK